MMLRIGMNFMVSTFLLLVRQRKQFCFEELCNSKKGLIATTNKKGLGGGGGV